MAPHTDPVVLEISWEDGFAPLELPDLGHALSEAACLLGLSEAVHMSLHFTTKALIQALNLEYRGKDYPTNVLSFDAELPEDLARQLNPAPVGELIIAPEVVNTEALAQNKSFAAHLTHLTVHGFLHLLGYDHELSDEDADAMESLEVQILSRVGINNPYL